MTSIEEALRRICAELASAGVSAAILGGLAVSARVEPRFTRDVDLAVAVAGDAEAEALIHRLQQAGYRLRALVEHTGVGRIATTRLLPPGGDPGGIVVDLLFASSGIEKEIVEEAESLELLPGLVVNVARAGHLVALKLLARDDRERPQDAVDLRALREVLTTDERARARVACERIESRGYARGRDLSGLLAEYLAE